MAPITHRPTKFSKFSKLPAELRNQIWWNALPVEDGPALFFYRKGCWCPLGQDPEYQDLIIFEFCDNLLDRVQVEMALAHVNREARSIALTWAQTQGFKLFSHKPRQCPVFARSFDSSRDAMYIGENEWDSFDREPYERAYEPDLLNHTTTTNSQLKRVAIPEAVFWNEIENLVDIFDWYCNVSFLFVVVNTPPEPEFNMKNTPPRPRWELEAVSEAGFVWDSQRREFNCGGDRVGDDEWQQRFEEALKILADGLVREGIQRFEVHPVFAVRA
ncbi:hypothetical protein HJFPF1_07101 [Paramyrothecium foliicola]|nr:hypothetical protein HJFPF1_07101 [Paramyrothecium foliicola]